MDKIAVVDFGSQYTHLITNRIRRLGVYSEILLPDTPVSEFRRYRGIILSGGPQSVYDPGALTIHPKIFELGIPILSICYGHQLTMLLLGGKVEPGKVKEYGLAKLTVLRKIGIFENLPKGTIVWMSHGDQATKLPKGFFPIAKTEDCPYAACANLEKKIFTIQFHAEVKHTPEGMKILSSFLDICGVKREWNLEKFLEGERERILRKVGDRNVFMLVSGGIDSSVAFILLTKILGKNRVYGLFVDTGFLRKDEEKSIVKNFSRHGFQNLHIAQGKKKFLSALRGTFDPEEKRKIIGNLFVEVQQETVRKLKLNPEHWMLGQGTIYPDTIESAGTEHADRIKTHHNRVPEILKLIAAGRVIEPLAELYKDEVRLLGGKLGLPESLVWKHPFPGPGLAVRILCAKEPYTLENENEREVEINEFLVPHRLFGRIVPVKSVGVQGDQRTYRHPLLVCGGSHDWDAFEKISTDLTNRFREINRVCLSLFPETIEEVQFHPADLKLKRVKLLQEADALVMNFVEKKKISRDIWQFPVVLLPISLNGKNGETIVLRPVCSDEAMTANFYKMDWSLLWELTVKLRKVPRISGVIYDITNKPPGTIEWE